MTAKERLLDILRGKGAERPACICPGGMMNMVTAPLMEACGVSLPEAHSSAEQMAALAKAVYDWGCFENVGVPFCMTVEAEAMGASVDLGSAIFEPRVVGYVMDSISERAKLPTLDIHKGRAKVVLEAIALLKEQCPQLPVIGNLTGPVSTAASLMEPMVFYRELRKKNEDAHAYMDFVTEQLLTFGLAQIRAGADVIAISDPSGTGEILGPKYFAEFAVPCLNRLVERFHREGVPVIVHICGQMSTVYQQVREIGSDTLSFDAIVSMKEAREQLPGRVLMGNVSTYALEFADPEKIAAMTRLCLNHGVHILAPACGLGMKTPLANEQAMLSCLKEVYHG